MTCFDGNDMGIYAGTSIESPFNDEISDKAIENQSHTLEYFLLKSGPGDTERALGVIKIDIEVE